MAVQSKLTIGEIKEWERHAKYEGPLRSDWRAYRALRMLANEVLLSRGRTIFQSVTLPCPFELGNGPCEEDMEFTIEITPGEKRSMDYPGSDPCFSAVNFQPCRHKHAIDEAALEKLYASAEANARETDWSHQ